MSKPSNYIADKDVPEISATDKENRWMRINLNPNPVIAELGIPWHLLTD
jgi:hypothetical protein